MELKQSKNKRLHLIDEYRGCVLINMIAYHAIWDLVYMFGVDFAWYRSNIGFIWQQWICWSFIFVSGFCWRMGKKPLARGLKVYAGGVVISAVTILFMPASRVVFGVLTLLGSSMILMILFDVWCQKINQIVGTVVSLLMFLFLYPVNRGYVGFGEFLQISIPKSWYANVFTTYLGFPEWGFYSTDYFSILPWFFLFLTGYFCSGILFDRKQMPEKNVKVKALLETSLCPALGWIGRKSLLIYMLHQPVVYGVLFLCNM